MDKVKTNIRRGDSVVVIAGKDKGKKGKVMMVNPEDGTCIVEGVNIIIKHKKARSAQQKSSREKKAGPIHISNVQILCKCGKATRVGHKSVNGKNVRVCVRCNEVLDKKFAKVKEKAKETEAEATDKEATAEKKQPLKRREVKHTAESKVKAPAASAKPTVALPRKTGGA
ncbi:MAG: 50S ribosomal protein L24 [Firmicutes bacterium]|nr:50S ribosomal protein L24 [Bacillota bacterium]